MQQPTNPELTLYQRLNQAGSDTKSLVTSAGAEFGIADDQMYQIGMVESGLKSGAKNTKSTATGLYQFTKGTWREVVNKYGPQYGIPKGTRPDDPTANAILGAAYLAENRDNFKSTYGKDASTTDLYLGHFLGQTGRKRFMDGLSSNPDMPAVNFVKASQARSNKDFFWDKDGKPRSAQEVYTLFGNKLGAVETQGVANELSTLQPDMHKSNVQERELGRVLGRDTQSELDVESARTDLRSKSLDIPLTDRNAKPFSDTVASYGLNVPQEEERGFIDEAFTAGAAHWRTSAYSQVANEAVLAGLHRASRAFGFDMEFDQEAMSVMQTFTDMTPEQMMTYDPRNPFVPTEAMLQKAFDSGIDRKWAKYMQGALTPDEFIRKVQLASEMQKAEADKKSVGTAANIAGAAPAAALDPMSYLSLPLKGATWGGRILLAGAEAAGANMLSDYLAELVSEGGVEADLATSGFSGLLFGMGLKGATEAFSNFPAATRMRGQQESLATGQPDITARPDVEVPEGQRYVELEGEKGAVVDADGNTHSATSVSNPKLIDDVIQEEIRANKGIDLGPASMLAHALLRSESKETRGIAADLVRSPTGIQGGGTGKTSMTAEDVLGRLEGQDNSWYVKAMRQRDALVDTKGVGKDAMQREIVQAIESGDLSKLSPESKAFAESIIELYTRKFDEATNVGRFGNADAPPVFASRRDPSRYVPQVFEEGKVLAAKMRFGGEEGWEGLQAAIKGNWKAQWKANHNDVQGKFKANFADEIQAKVDAGADPDKALMEFVEEYMEKKSYGISRNGDFTHSSGIEDAALKDSLVGIENNNFTMERNIFDSGYESLAADGGSFALNELRHFDLMNIAQMYNRRINGDVAIHASTGKDTKALKDRIIAIPPGRDRESLDQLVRLITGHSRVDNSTSALPFNAMMRGLQNLSFASNNAQMWINNLSEITGWAANRATFVMRNGTKGLSQLMNPQSKFSKADMKDFQSALFGNDLNTVMTKTFANSRDAMIQRGVGSTAASVAAGIDQAGAVLAGNKYNPFTRMLNATQEHLTGMARGGVLADITQEAFGGVKLNAAILKNASVTPEQYKGVLDMLKTHIKQVDGEFKPDVKAIVNDPRSNDLWRLADYIASDCVTRTGKVGMNYVAQPNAMMNLALQFKSFTLKGLNARTVRMFHETFYGGRSLDTAVRAVVMMGTMSALWSMQSWYRSLGVPEADRQAYLDKMLDPAMVGYQAVARSAELGPLLGGAGLILNPMVGGDLFRAGRSTIDPKSVALPKDPLRSEAATMKSSMERAGQFMADTVPATRTLMGLNNIGSGLVGMATSPYGYQQDMEKRAFFEGLGSFAPNDPSVQWLINELAAASGAAGKDMR